MSDFNDVYEVLSFLQMNLCAPKNQLNKFGGYKYRSCEDILEAVKKIMPKNAVLLLNDDIKMIGDRFYLAAEAILTFKGQSVKVNAFAREALNKKGMDDSQITGSTSSYARKYALNGLLCIEDSKDDDYSNRHEKQEEPRPRRAPEAAPPQPHYKEKPMGAPEIPLGEKAKKAKEQIEHLYAILDPLGAHDLTKGFSKELKQATAKLLSKDVLGWLTAISKNPPLNDRNIKPNYGTV